MIKQKRKDMYSLSSRGKWIVKEQTVFKLTALIVAVITALAFLI